MQRRRLVLRGGGFLGSGGGSDVPHGVMAARSKYFYGDGTRAGHGRKGSEPDCVHRTSNVLSFSNFLQQQLRSS